MSISIDMRRLAFLLAATLLLMVLAGCGLTAPRSSDGFADLDSLGLRDTDRVISLSIGPSLLRFAARHLDEDENEVRDLLNGLDGVRIRVYEVTGDSRRVAGRMDAMSQRLQADGWEPVMLVRRQEEQAHMLLRMADGRVCGMTVLVLDDESEAVIVNLMGEINPQHFEDLMVTLDVEAGGIDRLEIADEDRLHAEGGPTPRWRLRPGGH